MSSVNLVINGNDFRQSVIAQDDDEDYSESGYVAIVYRNRAYLASYSHCSCYGTFEAISDHSEYSDDAYEVPFDWEGTPNALVRLAKKKEDPSMKGRIAVPEDSDYDHLMKVYEQIIAWDERGRKPEERIAQ